MRITPGSRFQFSRTLDCFPCLISSYAASIDAAARRLDRSARSCNSQTSAGIVYREGATAAGDDNASSTRAKKARARRASRSFKMIGDSDMQGDYHNIFVGSSAPAHQGKPVRPLPFSPPSFACAKAAPRKANSLYLSVSIETDSSGIFDSGGRAKAQFSAVSKGWKRVSTGRPCYPGATQRHFPRSGNRLSR